MEEKKKAEAARKKAIEDKKKAEAARKKAVQAQRAKEAEVALEAAMAAEAIEQDEARNQILDAQMNQYAAQIQAKVERQWIRPKSAPKGLTCTLKVNQLPNGEIINVQIVKSSGNVSFDKSVEAAVLSASPLPQPPDPSLFSRELIFEFDPKD